MRPSSSRRFVVLWLRYQASGQLMASFCPGFIARNHPARFGSRCREGLFDHDVRAEGRNLLDVFCMCRRRRAEHHKVGLCRLEAGLDVGEDLVGRDREVRDRGLHALRIGVADARNLRVRVLMRLAQQVAHVHVVEIDADNAKRRHDLR